LLALQEHLLTVPGQAGFVCDGEHSSLAGKAWAAIAFPVRQKGGWGIAIANIAEIAKIAFEMPAV
jgi:hypothetical protein